MQKNSPAEAGLICWLREQDLPPLRGLVFAALGGSG
jgi:hypothetical protein